MASMIIPAGQEGLRRALAPAGATLARCCVQS
jgi:hypothetical protein